MTYIYDTKSGVDGSACLHAKKQEAGDNWDVKSVTDCLVIPPVKGDVKIKVKREDNLFGAPISRFTMSRPTGRSVRW